MEAADVQGGGSELERITARLEELAEELGANPDEEKAAELVAEASRLASEAGAEVEKALRGETA